MNIEIGFGSYSGVWRVPSVTNPSPLAGFHDFKNSYFQLEVDCISLPASFYSVI